MKKFTLYAWRADDEGGIGICESVNFTPSIGYHPETGCWARPSEKIGEFDTAQELAQLLHECDPDLYLSANDALDEAYLMIQEKEEY